MSQSQSLPKIPNFISQSFTEECHWYSLDLSMIIPWSNKTNQPQFLLYCKISWLRSDHFNQWVRFWSSIDQSEARPGAWVSVTETRDTETWPPDVTNYRINPSQDNHSQIPTIKCDSNPVSVRVRKEVSANRRADQMASYNNMFARNVPARKIILSIEIVAMDHIWQLPGNWKIIWK